MIQHIIDSKAARENYDIKTNDLFKVLFIPPKLAEREPLLVEHVKSVAGLRDPHPDLVEQTYGGSKKYYAGNALDTSQELTITFSQNLDKKKRNYIYKAIKSWRKLVKDDATGLSVTHADYIGKIIIEEYSRDKVLLETHELIDAFPFGELTGHKEYDYWAGEPVDLPITFKCAYKKDSEV